MSPFCFEASIGGTTLNTNEILLPRILVVLALLSSSVGTAELAASQHPGKLYAGASSITITPDERVALAGQMHTRISQKVESPCLAVALALETRKDDKSIDQAIFVSCDLVSLRESKSLYADLRSRLKGILQDEVLPKIILSATHTHTGPVLVAGSYNIPESGVMHPDEYREFLLGQLATVIQEAWKNRQPARVAWGLGYAVVAHNRRAVYENGTAVMYGKTNDPSFREIEGSPDHGVEILYFWNDKDELIATSVNVSCPSQVVEGRSTVNADFWHPVREILKEKHGENLHVLGWCGAAGDQAPRPMYRKEAELRMQKLRGIDALEDLGRRIVAAWEEVHQAVKSDRHDSIVLDHHVSTIQLPPRKITALEAKAAQAAADAITDPNQATRKTWNERVVKRYQDQQAGKVENFEMELHVIRLGDIAIATNDFELFTDYGVQMKARSPALQTFVIQLCGSGTYLPTANAAAGGGYSAIPQSNAIGPEGGQVLVSETVDRIKELWSNPASAENTATK